MLTYTFSLTEEQIGDFFKKYRAKSVKFLLIFSILIIVLGTASLVWDILDDKADMFVFGVFLILLGIVVLCSMVGIKKRAKTQTAVYFKSCQSDGIITYEYLLDEKEFVVTQPARGNVDHIYYDMIVRVTELDGYASVLLENNHLLPILINESTRPLIDTFKSFAKQPSKK